MTYYVSQLKVNQGTSYFCCTGYVRRGDACPQRESFYGSYLKGLLFGKGCFRKGLLWSICKTIVPTSIECKLLSDQFQQELRGKFEESEEFFLQ